MTAKRVGIFSGTFDPVHDGHVEFAKQAAREFNLDKVFFMVEPHPRRKQGVRAFEHRANMVRLAIEDDNNLGEIILEKQQQFTPHETLPVLKARFKGAGLFMLMGEDMLSHLGDWPHVDELIDGMKFIIGVRSRRSDAQSRLDTLSKTRGLKLDYQIIKTEKLAYSSSKIRASIKKGNAAKGLNPEVLAYIELNGLYASFNTSS